MYSVYQHWDPLKVCIVGRSYPPEFYSWIKNSKVRSLFEKIAIETEEDYQTIIKKLESFGVKILRPNIPKNTFVNGSYTPPPMTPRDHGVMIGNTFYTSKIHSDTQFARFYNCIKDSSWPVCNSLKEFETLPTHIKQECINTHHLEKHFNDSNYSYDKIIDHVKSNGNCVIEELEPRINGAMVSRIGRDLYFGTEQYCQDNTNFLNIVNDNFKETRNHIIDTGGHSDGTYCPVCPGLIISLRDIPTYADTFPDWEVIYLPKQSWNLVEDFLKLKEKNQGRWWIPGFEHNQDVVDVVETWLSHWTGYVEETVFDVNMLVVDPKNVIVFNYNKQVFDALDRYGITPHVITFRHRYFWDGGIHCVTNDLHRNGTMQDYFPNRL
jgi:glycine amidinotransferase